MANVETVDMNLKNILLMVVPGKYHFEPISLMYELTAILLIYQDKNYNSNHPSNPCWNLST